MLLRPLLPRGGRLLRAPTAAAAVARPWQCALPVARRYSIQPTASTSKPLDVDPTKLVINKTTNPKALNDPSTLVFGRNFTDHMLTIEWTQTDGWAAPTIQPYQNLSLDPATCVFHYGFECFEGMKAYRDAAGRVRLFRPDRNMARFNKSAARIALPTFDPAALTGLISRFAQLEERFIPRERGYSLYLRPTLIGTQRTLGVGPPGSALLFVIASPVGPYYPTGFKAVSLEATDYAVRAWPGGVGDKKLGANYAPCVLPQLEAASRGFQQNLWLFGPEQYVTEVGTMNLFVALRDAETGQKELVTAPLDGTILEGVTRDSVLSLARERLVPDGWRVSERKLTMPQLAEASEQGRLLEVFGAGTAAVVSPVRHISWRGRLVSCGLPDDRESGDVALQMKAWIEARQYGDEEHEWSYVCSTAK
ncbi:putative branched-chain amino acid aminotransferase [Rosellinia necatrix]|uniref:Branched-chain-amino-acid aminotransferase n=1 Tax=Rosellinia necatrix TaxID=77044 RepID=A0A1W2TJA6_ROSNE|nr:putative branched-chain amino acid aminotransferase [Rosellinia necatrix]